MCLCAGAHDGSLTLPEEQPELTLWQIMYKMTGYNIVAFLNLFVTSSAFPGMETSPALPRQLHCAPSYKAEKLQLAKSLVDLCTSGLTSAICSQSNPADVAPCNTYSPHGRFFGAPFCLQTFLKQL